MNGRNGGLVVAAACSIILGLAAPAQAEPPRLFVTDARLAAVRKAVARADSTQALALKELEARLAKGIDGYGGRGNKYAPAFLATSAAMHHLITGDAKSAATAFEAVKQSFSGKVTPIKGSGLERATMSKGVGIAYDWCNAAWTDEQRSFVKGKAKEALDAWPSFQHGNLGGNRASNWAGICRGGELLLLLGLREETARADRFKMLKNELRLHIESAYSTESAWCNEGTNYHDYTGQYLVPAILALRSVGDTELDKPFDAVPFWKIVMFSRSFAQARFRPGFMCTVTSGVDYPGIDSEGYVSLLLAVTPPDMLGYMRWFYDRHIGVLSPLAPDVRYDNDRDGIIWSLLYYPEKEPAQDPTGKLSPYLPDESRGVFYFRNRWRDADDVLFLAVANSQNDGGWNLPEALQINLVAGGTALFGGPGKDGVSGKNPSKFSKLVVDGAIQDARGGPSTFTPSKTGGYALLDGGECYRKSGVTVKRHVLVHLVREPSSAVIATVDDITAESDHKYDYQLALSNPKDDGGLKSVAGTEAGRPTFTITAPEGGYCKGWVLAPADATITAGDPTAARTAGKSMRLFVVMAVGTGKPPAATVTGEGMASAITVGGSTFKWDAAAGRIVQK